MFKNFRSTILIIFVAILAIGSLGSAVLFHYRYTQLQKNPNLAAEQKNKNLISAVGKLFNVESNETPTLAIITEEEKVRASNEFFARVKNGDAVLFYAQMKKAVLYRPSTNQIVEIVPLILEKTTSTASSTLSETPSETSTMATSTPITVALYNGTHTVGLTKTIETKLHETHPLFEVIKKTNAKKSDYSQTIIVPLTPAGQTQAEIIAKILSGTVGSLPSGEENSSADVAIILGGNP